MILFSGIILTADGVADIVFLIMIRLGMKKSEKLCAEKEQEENGKEKPWDEPADADLDEKVQDKILNERTKQNGSKIQILRFRKRRWK